MRKERDGRKGTSNSRNGRKNTKEINSRKNPNELKEKKYSSGLMDMKKGKGPWKEGKITLEIQKDYHMEG